LSRGGFGDDVGVALLVDCNRCLKGFEDRERGESSSMSEEGVAVLIFPGLGGSGGGAALVADWIFD
jgi:hypothetical protein